MLWRVHYGLCGAAPVANVVDAMKGRHVAMVYMGKLQKIQPALLNFAAMTAMVRRMREHVLESMYKRTKLQKVKKNQWKDDQKSSYTCFSQQRWCFSGQSD